MSDITTRSALQEFIASGRDIAAAEAVGKEWVGERAKAMFGSMFLAIAESSLSPAEKALRFTTETQDFAAMVKATLGFDHYAIPPEAREGVVTRIIVQGIRDAVDSHGGLKDPSDNAIEVGLKSIGLDGAGEAGTAVANTPSSGNASRTVVDNQTALLTALFDRFTPKGAGKSR